MKTLIVMALAMFVVLVMVVLVIGFIKEFEK
jgi:uncharacterized membrane protein (DUF485 family)